MKACVTSVGIVSTAATTQAGTRGLVHVEAEGQQEQRDQQEPTAVGQQSGGEADHRRGDDDERCARSTTVGDVGGHGAAGRRMRTPDDEQHDARRAPASAGPPTHRLTTAPITAAGNAPMRARRATDQSTLPRLEYDHAPAAEPGSRAGSGPTTAAMPVTPNSDSTGVAKAEPTPNSP